MSESGVDLSTIKYALRHSNIGTSLIYARLSADPARTVLEAHRRRVMEIAGRQRLAEIKEEKAASQCAATTSDLTARSRRAMISSS